MARRLISLRELDEIEGLVEHHRQLQERLETLEADAAQFDMPVQGTLELSRRAERIKHELVALLGQIATRVRS